jgi:hypothetical protein
MGLPANLVYREAIKSVSRYYCETFLNSVVYDLSRPIILSWISDDPSPVLSLGQYNYDLKSPDWYVATAMLSSTDLYIEPEVPEFISDLFSPQYTPPPPPFVTGEAENPGPTVPASSVQQPRSMAQAPKKQKTRNRRKKGNINISQNSRAANNLVSAPASIGYIANQNTFSVSSSVQRLADQDPLNGVRCSGSALYGSPVQVYSDYGSGASAYPLGYTGGLSSVTAGKGRGLSYLAPGEIDPRLTALVSCYQWYAFRRICLKYIPYVGTNTPGTVFMAISKDPEEAGVLYTNVAGAAASPSAGTIQEVMDTDPAVACPVWQPSLIEFVHRGVKLWQTYSNTEEPIVERLQAAIVLLLQLPSSGSFAIAPDTAGLFGNLWLEYEIDLYTPGPPLNVN